MTASEASSREATSAMRGLLIGTILVGLAFACLVFTVIAVIFVMDRLALKAPPPGFSRPHAVLEGENPYERDPSQR